MMDTRENQAVPVDGEREHTISILADIDGINHKSAEALYEYGFRSYDDLAQCTEDEFLKVLLKQGVKYPPHMLKRYNVLGEARARAKQTSPESTAADVEAEGTNERDERPRQPTGHPTEFQFTVTVTCGTNEHGRGQYTTTVYDGMPEYGEEKVFEPSETTLWANWILDRVRLHLGSGPSSVEASAVASSPRAIPNETSVEILPVEVSEARRSRWLAAKVCFRLLGKDAPTLAADRTPYWIYVHAHDLETGAVSLVADECGSLVPGQIDYPLSLRFPLPELGHYQLQSTVLLLPPVEKMAFYKGPKFRVVPYSDGE